MAEYHKVKSPAKEIVTKGPELEQLIQGTMKKISDIVGATLGPGGQPVLLERQEHGLPALITKDGVTVFRSLGFGDPAAHCVAEAARDAASRTVAEAGDGTTTATVLSEAIYRLTRDYCRGNPRVSPQRVVGRLREAFRDCISPLLVELSAFPKMDTEDGATMLRAVAQISANGDSDLADAVMECYEASGDEGNVTIVESSGPFGYEVEKIDGFHVPMGYEDSTGKFYPKFLNDPGNQRVFMEKPVFILYHGRLTEIQSIVRLLETCGLLWQEKNFNHNIILVATGFSEMVLGQLALNFHEGHTINVFPLLVPQSPMANGQFEFLRDLSAITGAAVFDPLNLPLDSIEWERAVQEGVGEDVLREYLGEGLDYFECYRFRANVAGVANEDVLLARVEEVQQQLKNPASELDKILLQERLAKITGGIAKLRVIGSSGGELKERRDRAEDAICAVRGAIKDGCVPGGGWTLLKIAHELHKLNDPILQEVLIPALYEPVKRLLLNIGVTTAEEEQAILSPVLKSLVEGDPVVYDALESVHVDPYGDGILDSTPAIREAIRNSISIASLLGTLGGAVVFERDKDLEVKESQANHAFLRNSGHNPANERP